jgi:hypothetical protein
VFKTLTIFALFIWNLSGIVPPEPDMIIGVALGVFAGLLVFGVMVVKASRLHPAPQPVRIRQQTQRRKPVARPARQRYPANWPLPGQMALQGA